MPPNLTYQSIVITIPTTTLAEVRRRLDANATKGKAGNNVSGTLTEALARYYEGLRRERATLRPTFSAAECGALIDVSNGTLYQAHSIPLVWAEVEDSLPDGLAGKWQVDGAALVAKLRGLSYGQAAALVDALERWWLGPYRQEAPDYGALLAEEVQT